MVTTWALIAAAGLMADGVSTKFIPNGVTAKLGGYSPIQAKFSEQKPEVVKKVPEGLTAANYGEIKMGSKSWTFVIDEPEGKPAKLVVDTNGDGDLTNDGEATWESKAVGGQTMYNGTTKVDLGEGNQGVVNMYRFDPKDPRRATLKNTLLFYADFGYEVKVNLDGTNYESFTAGLPGERTSLWIDRNGDGQTSYKLEMVRAGAPFNFTGTTYVLNTKDGKLTLDKADKELPKAPLPPDLAVGKKAPTFEAVATDGTKIEFPKSFAGKLVMLDFWATWCGPCIAELPNVKKAYQAHHEKGFEVLGISFDRANMDEKLAEFTKKNEMPWQQIYEGKFWETSLGELYDVSGIPFVLLIDGDTGEIVGTRNNLRGPGLSDFIEKALVKKASRGT